MTMLPILAEFARRHFHLVSALLVLNPTGRMAMIVESRTPKYDARRHHVQAEWVLAN